MPFIPSDSLIRELKHQAFLTTRTAGRSRRTVSRPAFLARNRKVKQSVFLRHGRLRRVDMSSLNDARDLTLISHSQGLITVEELLLLLEENKSRNPELSYDVYDRFDLENMEEAECKSEFRVKKHDIPLLAKALGLPETSTCPQRSVAAGIERFCMVLKRMSFPCRYSDMIYRFDWSFPVLSPL